MLIDKKFLERHQACKSGKDWWLRNKLDFLHYEDLDKKVTGDFNGYIEWLKNLRLDDCKFDEAGNMISMAYFNGDVKWTYDEDGNKTSQTNPMGDVTNWTYDKNNNMISQIDADGYNYNWIYDENGNKTSETYSNGYAFNWTYDKAGNRTSETDTDGDVYNWTLDKAGNKISETHSSSVTKWTYDKFGNMISQANPDGSVVKWTHDKVGNIISLTYFSKHITVPKHTTWEHINNKDVFIVLEDDNEVLRIDKKPNNEVNYNVIQNQVSHYREMYERETKLLDIIVVYCKSQIKENTKINAENKKLKKKLNRRKLC